MSKKGSSQGIRQKWDLSRNLSSVETERNSARKELEEAQKLLILMEATRLRFWRRKLLTFDTGKLCHRPVAAPFTEAPRGDREGEEVQTPARASL
jgi:hypothetical protein